MRLGYALLRTSDESGVEQTARLFDAGCEKVYLERPQRQPRLARDSSPIEQRQPRLAHVLGCLKPRDILVVDDLTRLTQANGTLSMVLATLRILDAGFIALSDGLDTVDGPHDQIFRIFEALDRFHQDRTTPGQFMTDTEIAAAREMLSSRALSISQVAKKLGVSTSVLVQNLGPSEMVAKLLITSLQLR